MCRKIIYEKDHPRDGNGQFVEKGGGKEISNLPSANKQISEYERRFGKSVEDAAKELKGVSAGELKERLQQDKDVTKKRKTREEFFGEEFTDVKGADAIEKLLKEKRGHVKNAFTRPEIGGIDLVWGDENGGLLHTIQKRDRLLAKGIGNISGLDMVKKIPDIIDKGKFDIDDNGRINIDYDGYRVGIIPSYFGEKLNWIVTAMEKWQ